MPGLNERQLEVRRRLVQEVAVEPAGERYGWQAQASCLGAPAELFYPNHPNQEMAREIWDRYCHRCPVWRSCFEASRSERLGIWAGLLAGERRRLRFDPHLARLLAGRHEHR